MERINKCALEICKMDAIEDVTLQEVKDIIIKHFPIGGIHNLEKHRDETVGLRAIDRNPKEVTKEWIDENCFQIKY